MSTGGTEIIHFVSTMPAAFRASSFALRVLAIGTPYSGSFGSSDRSTSGQRCFAGAEKGRAQKRGETPFHFVGLGDLDLSYGSFGGHPDICSEPGVSVSALSAPCDDK